MSLPIKRIDLRRYDPAKMQKLTLFETERFFCDIYCLDAGQSQSPHAHDGADKVYAVLEGTVTASVGEDEAVLGVGDAVLAPAGRPHGIRNTGPGRAAVLVFMAPHP
ncbi:MAG TPA: cupin domain-containing protein [Polyangia bacterium]|jgi:mannose-6-phosphate isomerase-like protein (cupin superfamily)|nr:cupin domain-containing protein [Polyangia bacterium]